MEVKERFRIESINEENDGWGVLIWNNELSEHFFWFLDYWDVEKYVESRVEPNEHYSRQWLALELMHNSKFEFEEVLKEYIYSKL